MKRHAAMFVWSGLALATLLYCGVAAARSASHVGAKVRVPNVVSKKLPLAEYIIRGAGLRVGKEDCDCTFGVVIKSHWYVCIQKPKAGSVVARGTRVSTYSDRSPDDC